MEQGIPLPAHPVPLSPRNPGGETVADLLHDLTEGGEGKVTARILVEHLGRKGFGPVLLALGVPMVAPLPPGAAIIFALPLLIVCLQMVVGRKTLWLPDWMADKGIERRKLAPLVAKVIPWVERVERHLKPRLCFLVEGWGARVLGVTCTVIAVVLVLPVPFANLVPSLATTAFGLALARRDGLMALAGYGLTVASVLVIVVMVSAVGYGWQHYVHQLIHRWF